MRPNLDGRVFRSVSNTDNGEVGAQTEFQYRQSGDLVTADYSGGSIVEGHLIATMDADGNLDMRYHHLNASGALMVGTCRSRPETLADGRLRYHESWRWLSGDGSEGESVIEER
ncbi:MAG: n-acetylglutamate synthase [Spirochaetaceae bacterium]|nr:MAG: n-acetylglutamate synthase [Spirochaetaceae bacterium]